MRQRITFLQEADDFTNPESLQVTTDSISSTTEIKGGREDRITFGFDELPQELYKVLKASHEIHVRWVSDRPYDGIGPLVGRMSPGLHVFYTPQRGGKKVDDLCPLLKKVFGEIDYISPEKSFTTLPTERFSHSAATQYYTPLSTLNSLSKYLTHRLCTSPATKETCLSRIALLSTASTLDIDFDTISHAVTLTSYTPPRTWPLSIKNHSPTSRLEIGILSVTPPSEPEELSLGGFLTVLGEHSKPTATLFSFPSRHHTALGQKFSSNFIQPTGLHPSLELKITGVKAPVEDRGCKLHAHLTLPKEIFADKYQLSDPLFLASKNLSALHYSSPNVDLEAPSYTTSTWGSSLLLALSPPSESKSQKDPQWTSQIPLHLRYLPPSTGTNGLTKVEIPYPVLFWACTADEGSKFPINPFDRVNTGYEGLFGVRTMFYHVVPELSAGVGGEGRLINALTVPVLDLDRAWYVESATAFVVVLGFGWVVWCLVRVWVKNGYGNSGQRKKIVVGGGEGLKLKKKL